MCAISAPFVRLALGAMAGFICLYSSQVMSSERDRLCIKDIVPPFAFGDACLTRKDVCLFNKLTHRQRYPSYLGSSNNPIAPTLLPLRYEVYTTHPYALLLSNTYCYVCLSDFVVGESVVHPRQSNNFIEKFATELNGIPNFPSWSDCRTRGRYSGCRTWWTSILQDFDGSYDYHFGRIDRDDDHHFAWAQPVGRCL